jgi:predicted Zn-dependent peptidase
MYKKTILDNGLKIISHPMPDRQSLALGIWVNVGGRYESFENKGISHYLEHLLFKGTKDYTCRQIKESIEGIGGYLNAFTAEEFTCYLVKIPYRYLETALDILSDMVINPALSGEEMEKERTVILEEIKMYKDQPHSYVYDLLDELLWPDQPLGLPIIGTKENVSRMTREEVSSFKEAHYTARNIVVSAAGGLNHERLVKSVTKKFRHLKSDKANIFAAVRESQDNPQLNLFAKDTEQTHMAMGFHAFKRDHPMRHATGMLHIVLGANMSSRLFHEIREKRGLAYEIGTQVKRFRDTGAFLVHAGIDNRKVPETTRLIMEELRKCKDKLVTDSEFKRAKEFYLGQLMLALEDTMDHMLWIGESTVSLNKTYSLKDIVKEVNKVKPKDIRQAALEVFQDNKLSLALIGPVKEQEQDIYKELRLS